VESLNHENTYSVHPSFRGELKQVFSALSAGSTSQFRVMVKPFWLHQLIMKETNG